MPAADFGRGLEPRPDESVRMEVCDRDVAVRFSHANGIGRAGSDASTRRIPFRTLDVTQRATAAGANDQRLAMTVELS